LATSGYFFMATDMRATDGDIEQPFSGGISRAKFGGYAAESIGI
jgi:hypothetical protein